MSGSAPRNRGNTFQASEELVSMLSVSRTQVIAAANPFAPISAVVEETIAVEENEGPGRGPTNRQLALWRRDPARVRRTNDALSQRLH